jgi:flavin reductase (DIM6/NTAB) family NADH-FMN oxidoreductase RutF
MVKKILTPNTTLYPVPVVIISAGAGVPNVMTCNRISSCSAEPPRLAISVRPSRYTHAIIREMGEFVVSLPAPEQSTLTDYLGVVGGKEEDKAAIARLRLTAASVVQTPLLDDFPVNIECKVEKEIDLDSHTLFIGLVLAVHADDSILDARGEVDIEKARGIVYASGVVRERPVYRLVVDELRESIRTRR